MLDGYDLFQGAGANRDAQADEEAVVLYANTSVHPYLDDTDIPTLVIDNNHAALARVTVVIYVAMGA